MSSHKKLASSNQIYITATNVFSTSYWLKIGLTFSFLLHQPDISLSMWYSCQFLPSQIISLTTYLYLSNHTACSTGALELVWHQPQLQHNLSPAVSGNLNYAPYKHLATSQLPIHTMNKTNQELNMDAFTTITNSIIASDLKKKFYMVTANIAIPYTLISDSYFQMTLANLC